MGARRQHVKEYIRLRKQLRGWREAAGLTQRALAAKLKRVHSYVFKVETGERRIDPLEFAEWCEACGVEPAKGLRLVLRG